MPDFRDEASVVDGGVLLLILALAVQAAVVAFIIYGVSTLLN